jgi:hypothetical protein
MAGLTGFVSCVIEITEVDVATAFEAAFAVSLLSRLDISRSP